MRVDASDLEKLPYYGVRERSTVRAATAAVLRRLADRVEPAPVCIGT